MTYRELYEKAERKLEKGEITSGEFDEMTKPLDEEIRPHGEWKMDSEYGFIFNCSCSECNSNVMKYISGSENWWLNSTPNFCPNCGADMRTKNVRSWDTSERGASGTVSDSITQKEGESN